jgi:hypothetical protein
VLGFVLITSVLLVVLAQAPRVLISTNYVSTEQALGPFARGAMVCQAGERVPASTTALRISLEGQVGPAVYVTLSHGQQLVSGGHLNAGWVSDSPTFPLQPPVATPVDAKICLTRGPGGMRVELAGNATHGALAATVNGRPVSGRMRVEYLARGNRSWLSLAKHVARRLGLGHAPAGTWIVLPLAALMATAVALGAWLLMREASR